MGVSELVDSTAACTLLCFFWMAHAHHLQRYNTSLLLTSHPLLMNLRAGSMHPPTHALLYIQRGFQGDAYVIVVRCEAVPGSIDTSSNLKEEREEREEG
jgi:hypothetical protein